MMRNAQCLTCQYWATTDEKIEPESIGQCRVNSPVVDPFDDNNLMGRWPYTACTDWCGNYDEIVLTAEEIEEVEKAVANGELAVNG